MKNIKEKLEQIVAFKDFITKRAHEILRIRNSDVKFYARYVDFTLESVDVEFQEDTRHDCPDYERVSLPISLIEMGEVDFEDYLEQTREEKALEIERKTAQIRESEIKNKTAQFDRLKKELGK
jgi:hypothetical protein